MINKSVLLSSFTVIIFQCGIATAAQEPLASWHNTKSKQTIIAFVSEVTDPNSANFVIKSERVATFDNDGTLWAEQPIYTQLLFAIERIYALAPNNPQWQSQEPFATLLKGDIPGALTQSKTAVNDIVMAANTGMDNETYNALVSQWIKTAKHPVTQRPFTNMVYQPMLELIRFLQQSGFKTYIVSGGGTAFIRAWSESVYGIPPEQVIGSTMKRTYELQNNKMVIIRHPEMDFYNNNSNKVIAINTHIGRRPIAAFGNSDGDMQMLEYVSGGTGLSLSMIIHHTDAKREWAYDRKSEIGKLDKGLNKAAANNWRIVDMEKDWKVIYPEPKP
ncbi:MAG: phosphoglycolate phosphatase-like HAD superfamily hydrolase [Glaciecola sp.]|jgi:phosphoglycolate phosphatase-like HAD superfamily hydrolase